MKFLSDKRTQELVEWIKNTFTQKDGLKVLSDNNYTDKEKKKLADLDENGEANIIERIKRNGIIQSVGSDKSVDIKVPTKLSELTNDKTYITETELNTAINSIQSLSFEFVNSLPASGKLNTIYLIPDTENEGEHVEYVWLNGGWEMLGKNFVQSEFDASGFVKQTDEMTAEELEKIIRGN